MVNYPSCVGECKNLGRVGGESQECLVGICTNNGTMKFSEKKESGGNNQCKIGISLCLVVGVDLMAKSPVLCCMIDMFSFNLYIQMAFFGALFHLQKC